MTTDSNIEYLRRVERGAKRMKRKWPAMQPNLNTSVFPKSRPLKFYDIDVDANEYLFASLTRRLWMRAQRMSQKLTRWIW